MMTPVVDVERVSVLTAQLQEELAAMVSRLADKDLQLADVRSERDQEHQRAEREHEVAEALRAALDNSAAIEQAIGIIAEKAKVGIPAARQRLRSYSRDHGEKIRAVAATIVAGQDQADIGLGDPHAARIVAAAGIPASFWNDLTLNGAIFE